MTRFGAVPYLNARPLVEGLDPLTLEAPAALAHAFEAGQVDVALLPVVAGEALGAPRIADLGIAADGRVDSVLLFLRQLPEEVRTVYLDPDSRTSNVLALLLLRSYGLDPEVVDDPFGADAELVIGDRALLRNRESPDDVLDLGAAWKQRTGLPFVFAAWYGDESAAGELKAAYKRGRGRLAEYAAAGERSLGIPAVLLEQYLRDRIRFQLGRAERKGLQLFLDEARKESLL
ncbi:MAG: menaquinone biosynthetic enzyme MqnA/MqnD family protein [Planctomycetota bacterium]|nr:menaquinone biosynthesis protein [Planctomycetota bacterium]